MRLIWIFISLVAVKVFAEPACISVIKVRSRIIKHHTIFMQWKKPHQTTVLATLMIKHLNTKIQKHAFIHATNSYLLLCRLLNGTLTDYPVLYTFGYEPLQQYMFDMGGGPHSAFPFAWDSRSKGKRRATLVIASS